MNTVVVTGAGGFIGSAVVRRLVADGSALWDGTSVDHVVAAVRPGGSLERLETLQPAESWSIQAVDLDDAASVRGLTASRRPRAVVHTALDASVHDGRPLGHAPLGSLLDGLAELEGTRFVHTGSAWVLASGLRLAEDAPLAPSTAYARHKAEEDALLPQLAEARGISWLNLRLFNVFGRYEKRARLLPSLVDGLSRGVAVDVSHGAQTRDFNDVDEIARAFLLALRAPETAWNRLYHIGTGRATSARDFALEVAVAVGNPDLIRFGAGATTDEGLAELVSDPSTARQLLGWKVEATLEEQIRSAVEWWLERLTPHTVPRRAEESIR